LVVSATLTRIAGLDKPRHLLKHLQWLSEWFWLEFVHMMIHK
jgi:hypothetical protein